MLPICNVKEQVGCPSILKASDLSLKRTLLPCSGYELRLCVDCRIRRTYINKPKYRNSARKERIFEDNVLNIYYKLKNNLIHMKHFGLNQRLSLFKAYCICDRTNFAT
jgi:hypothetical protein